MIKMCGLADSASDEEPIASRKSKRKKKTNTKTKSVTMNNLLPNKDIAGMPNANSTIKLKKKKSSKNDQSVSKNTSLDNVAGGADHAATTHGTILNDNGIATALTADSLGVSATVTAATANTTISGDAANDTSPKKGKRRNK
jgi:hypothetical protein